jgi:undecaprenyl-diphosphatase
MDQKLLLLINQKWTSPALDRFMALMSSLDAWLPVFVLIILALAVWGGFRGRACLLTVAFVLAINDGMVVNSLKIAIHRLRPHEEMSGVRQVDLAKAKPRFFALAKPLKIGHSTRVIDSGQGRSFPSGHVIDTMSVAVLLTLFYPRRGWLAFLVPLIVGYSRIYVGSHWPSDVIASYFIGAGSTLLLATFGELAWQKIAPKLRPGLQAQHPTLFAIS